MNLLAVIVADLDKDFFGAPGRMGEELRGESPLRRTARRVKSLKGLSAICVVCPKQQVDRCRDLVEGLEIDVIDFAPADLRAAVMRRARAFGRYGWRGGLADASFFDELLDPMAMAAACNRHPSHAFMPVAGGAVLLDRSWTQQVIDRFGEQGDRLEYVISQAPIGLSAGIFTLGFYNKLLEARIHMGRVLGYDPMAPRNDVVFDAVNVKLPDYAINTPYRFLADGPRGFDLCGRIIDALGASAEGEDICRFVRAMGPEPMPRELTIELCTERPVTDKLRPVAQRPPLDLNLLRRALEGLEPYGDINIMFDGLGDGLLHPQWRQAVEIAGRYGTVGLSTYLHTIDETLIEHLAESRLSVLQVYLDALTEETYALTRDGASAAAIWANLEAYQKASGERNGQFPFLVPCMLKTPPALIEQEEYYDRARGLCGWSVVREPSDYAGRAEVEGVFDMSPPTRTPCRRIDWRLAMSSDGVIRFCEEDFFLPDTSLPADSFMQAWQGEALERLRACHRQQRWDDLELCRNCREFHRP